MIATEGSRTNVCDYILIHRGQSDKYSASQILDHVCNLIKQAIRSSQNSGDKSEPKLQEGVSQPCTNPSHVTQSYLLHSSSAPDLGVMVLTSFESSGFIEFANVFQPKRYGMIKLKVEFRTANSAFVIGI